MNEINIETARRLLGIIDHGLTNGVGVQRSRWSSNEARAKGLRRVAVAQLGSLGVVNDDQFRKFVARETIRVIVPIALRHAAKAQSVELHQLALEAAAVKCENEPTHAAANAAANAVNAAVNAEIDRILTISSDICLAALRECGSPGVALLDQIEAEAV